MGLVKGTNSDQAILVHKSPSVHWVLGLILPPFCPYKVTQFLLDYQDVFRHKMKNIAN